MLNSTKYYFVYKIKNVAADYTSWTSCSELAEICRDNSRAY